MMAYHVPDNTNSCHYQMNSHSAALDHQPHDIRLLTLVSFHQWFVLLPKREYFLGQQNAEDRVDFSIPLLVYTSMTI